MTNMYNDFDEDNSLLPTDFDDVEEQFFRRKINIDDDFDIGNDPLDAYDIFPKMIDRESKFYPGMWF